ALRLGAVLLGLCLELGSHRRPSDAPAIVPSSPSGPNLQDEFENAVRSVMMILAWLTVSSGTSV
ncbi:MAG: hypothetical protein OXD42_06240, partial [Rhodospirillaceae bacterium]|nr:hypothetical protein [Rhodospirillaceae bacterium]